MTKNHIPSVTRRTFGQMLGAAAVSVPTISSAAELLPRDETILELNSVPLAWPQYQKMSTFVETPLVGDPVTLVREAQNGFDDEAVAVYTSNFKRLGYISRQHNAAFSWALERGEAREARISRIAEPLVGGKRISGGWGAIHVDVRVSAQALA